MLCECVTVGGGGGGRREEGGEEGAKWLRRCAEAKEGERVRRETASVFKQQCDGPQKRK